MGKCFEQHGNLRRGAWWFRIWKLTIIIRPPWDKPYFTERHGFWKPWIKIKGWRIGRDIKY